MAKGPLFERQISKKLSEWWSRKGDDDLFWRTHGSGSRATMRTKGGKKTRGQYGDIAATDGRGKKLIQTFVISLKKGYQGTSIQDILDQTEKSNRKPSLFERWIKDCLADRLASDSLYWMLIFKKNGPRDTLVFFPMQFALSLPIKARKRVMEFTPQLTFRIQSEKAPKQPKDLLTWYLQNNAVVYGMPLDAFLNIVSRDDVLAVLERGERA